MNNTLALNTIVGPNEADNLLQCLRTVDAKNIFDEIVLCFTSKDIYEAANYQTILDEFQPTCCFHEWTSERYPFGNFAAARNTCIEHTQSRYIAWLDCDDDLLKSSALINLKRQILSADGDFYMLGYLINENHKGEFNTRFLKERIFLNVKHLRWKYPVHEQLDARLADKLVIVEGIDIKHRSKKSPLKSIERNLKILDHELKVDPCAHNYLFHANEMMSKFRNTNDPADLKQALEEMEFCVDHRYGSEDILAMMCYTIAMYHTPMFLKQLFNIECKEEEIFIAEMYASIAIALSGKYAESHFILGETYLMKNDESRAIFHYKEALKKKLDGICYQSFKFYEFLPACRLMDIFARKKEPELALWYNKRALIHAADDPELHRFRKNMLEFLLSDELKNTSAEEVCNGRPCAN